MHEEIKTQIKITWRGKRGLQNFVLVSFGGGGDEGWNTFLKIRVPVMNTQFFMASLLMKVNNS